LAALAPDSVSPLAVTVLLTSTAADANVALPAHVTTSPPITPVKVQLVIVALAVPSYVLLDAVTAGVTGFWLTVSALLPLEAL
jgi:hypothetical protein